MQHIQNQTHQYHACFALSVFSLLVNDSTNHKLEPQHYSWGFPISHPQDSILHILFCLKPLRELIISLPRMLAKEEQTPHSMDNDE